MPALHILNRELPEILNREKSSSLHFISGELQRFFRKMRFNFLLVKHISNQKIYLIYLYSFNRVSKWNAYNFVSKKILVQNWFNQDQINPHIMAEYWKVSGMSIYSCINRLWFVANFCNNKFFAYISKYIWLLRRYVIPRYLYVIFYSEFKEENYNSFRFIFYVKFFFFRIFIVWIYNVLIFV